MATPQGEVSRDLTRWDMYEIIFGTFWSVIGLALIALSLLRWKTIDLSLVSFGILCFLYGARTKAFQFLFDIPLLPWTYTFWFITYLIPIPAWLFAEQFLGKGWKSSVRRLLQVQIVFSIIAISASAYLGNPYAAMAANNIIVIIGLLFIIANFFQPHLQLNRQLKMLRAGFFIFALLALHANIAPWLKKGYGSFYLEWLGFLIFISCLGYAVAYRFFQLENDFVTAGYLFLDTKEKNLIYAGAGHMPLLLWRAAEKLIYEFREKGTILGQFEDIQFKNIRFALEPDDRMILYTDGIVETSNPAHTLFGVERLKEFIMSHAQLPAGQFADTLIRQIFNWSGKPSEEALDDDLTLIVADFQHA